MPIVVFEKVRFDELAKNLFRDYRMNKKFIVKIYKFIPLSKN